MNYSILNIYLIQPDKNKYSIKKTKGRMQNKIHHSPYYLLRTPAYTYDSFSDWKQELKKDTFRKALFFSSPDLYDLLLKSEDPAIARDTSEEKKKKIEKSLFKYWLRMSFRPTPFGLMAGTTFGKWGDRNEVLLNQQNKEYPRLDMLVTCQLTEELEQYAPLKNKLIFFPNNTINYTINDKIRYIEPKKNNGYIAYELTNLEKNEYLEKALTLSADGITPVQLAEAFLDEDVNLEDALEYVDELIGSGILISEISPKVTDDNYEQYLLGFLEEKIATDPAIQNQWLEKVIAILAIAQNLKQEQHISIETAKLVQEKLEDIGITAPLKTLFQIDLIKGAETNILDKTIFEELKASLFFLCSSVEHTEQPGIAEFKTKFAERFDEQEVPILVALDPSQGISYPVGVYSDPSNLTENVHYGSSKQTLHEKVTEWDKFLKKIYWRSLSAPEKVINLTKEDINSFKTEHISSLLPFSMLSLVHLFQDDDGEPVLYHAFSDGPSSSTLLGRFCSGDPALETAVKQSLKNEEEFYSEKIIAEIVHLPQQRIGNIVRRPQLRDFEIPVITTGNNSSHKIDLNDLYILLRNNRIVLWSKKHNKEVVPSLSSAHDYSKHNIPLYKFLSDLQYQGLTSTFKWNWGTFRTEKSLPRVMLGKTILTKASWRLDVQEIFGTNSPSPEAIRSYFKQNNISRFTTLQERDNQLPIDIENELSADLLIEFLLKNKTIRVEEDLFRIFKSPIKSQDPLKTYNNEILIPWEYQGSYQRNISHSFTGEENLGIQRTFAPGSQWSYYKIYCGISFADSLIHQLLYPLMANLEAQQLIDKWFFIRYNDPEFHIRIRFHHTDTESNIASKLNAVLTDYIQDGTIWKVQSDTYKREIERYGADSITYMEDIFHYDAIAVAQSLIHISEYENDNQRWEMALIGMDSILNDFNIPLEKRKQLTGNVTANFLREFNMDTSESRDSLSLKHRAERSNIEQLLANHNIFRQIFDYRSQQTAPAILQLKKQLQDGVISGTKYEELVCSYIHMFINRFFRYEQRLHELVLYYYLNKTYTSALAKNHSQLKNA